MVKALSVVYEKSMSAIDKIIPQRFQAMWQHPAGPKTIFFWAPAFKWSLVIAGISDLRRPAEDVSIPQTTALAATGLIWSRYSLVITPKNYSLFSVNVFVALTQCFQLYRAINYTYNKEPETVQIISKA